MSHKTVTALRFEQAALLFAENVPFVGAEHRGRRVALEFVNEDGRAEDLLHRHDREGVMVNSRRYDEGLSRARALVFATRDREG